MKRLLLFGWLCACTLAASGQHLAQVKADVEALCDSAMHGRGYAHDGSNRAAAYLVQRFREMGITPLEGGYLQPFTLSVNVYEAPTSLSIKKIDLREGHDYITDASSGISSGKYKIAFFDSTHFAPGSTPKLRKGTAPVVHMKGITTPDQVAAFHSFKLAALDRVPVVQLVAGLTANGPEKLTWSVGERRYRHAALEVRASAFPERAKSLTLHVAPEMRTTEVANVVGKITGLRSDSCLVLTAHYDHLGRLGTALFAGANDNASGTATLLDLAAYFTSHPPPMDLYLIAFAAEEAGLKGSKHFVDHPLVPLEKMRFLINLDLIGSAAEGITIVNGRLYEEEIARIGALNRADGLVPKIKLRGKAANSDHYWFAEAGVKAIFIYTEGNVRAYHDVHDVPAALDWANYEGVFTLIRTFIETF